MTDKKVSVIRQNFHAEAEAAINKQVNLELYASYVYQSMVSITLSIFLKRIVCNWKILIYFFFVILRLSILIARMLPYQVSANSLSTTQKKSESMLRSWWNTKTSVVVILSSRTSKDQRRTPGVRVWRLWRPPLLLRRTSTSLCLTCTVLLRLTMTLTWPTSSRSTIWRNKWRQSKTWVRKSLSWREPVLVWESTCSIKSWAHKLEYWNWLNEIRLFLNNYINKHFFIQLYYYHYYWIIS